MLIVPVVLWSLLVPKAVDGDLHVYPIVPVYRLNLSFIYINADNYDEGTHINQAHLYAVQACVLQSLNLSLITL